LLEIIRRDRGFKEDIGRKQMLALFNVVDNPDLVREYRRRLANVLH
ncbi:MAG TPA: tetratricopeptide repeat protein, partial [Gammaproteobacteria bacterium]|nr:tetratricopeptide repeat protein [Gammaproteobacteria bacterium]